MINEPLGDVDGWFKHSDVLPMIRLRGLYKTGFGLI